MDVVLARHENNGNHIVHFHQSSWLTMYMSIRSNILKGVFFFRAIGLRTRLKIFSELCCEQMCCDPGFVVPFTEHRQSRFSMNLKCPRTFEIMSEYWLQLKVSSYIIFSYEHQPIL